MNQHSSRSHLVVRLTIESRPREDAVEPHLSDSFSYDHSIAQVRSRMGRSFLSLCVVCVPGRNVRARTERDWRLCHAGDVHLHAELCGPGWKRARVQDRRRGADGRMPRRTAPAITAAVSRVSVPAACSQRAQTEKAAASNVCLYSSPESEAAAVSNPSPDGEAPANHFAGHPTQGGLPHQPQPSLPRNRDPQARRRCRRGARPRPSGSRQNCVLFRSLLWCRRS